VRKQFATLHFLGVELNSLTVPMIVIVLAFDAAHASYARAGIDSANWLRL
jgi:hypothetical protein